jgi:hypothetical protein
VVGDYEKVYDDHELIDFGSAEMKGSRDYLMLGRETDDIKGLRFH